MPTPAPSANCAGSVPPFCGKTVIVDPVTVPEYVTLPEPDGCMEICVGTGVPSPIGVKTIGVLKLFPPLFFAAMPTVAASFRFAISVCAAGGGVADDDAISGVTLPLAIVSGIVLLVPSEDVTVSVSLPEPAGLTTICPVLDFLPFGVCTPIV